MGVRKRRLTLGRLMAVIGIIALGFAMSRVDAAPAVSVCVFVACTWYLAARRYAEALGRRAAEGIEIVPSRRPWIAARCVLGAALAIGLPDAAFLGGYYGYMYGVFLINGVDRWRPDLEPQHILFGAVVGSLAALYVAAIMRPGPRPAARRRIARPADRAASGPSIDADRITARPGGLAHRFAP